MNREQMKELIKRSKNQDGFKGRTVHSHIPTKTIAFIPTVSFVKIPMQVYQLQTITDRS